MERSRGHGVGGRGREGSPSDRFLGDSRWSGDTAPGDGPTNAPGWGRLGFVSHSGMESWGVVRANREVQGRSRKEKMWG